MGRPPFETDDPEPVEYGHWEIFFPASYSRTLDDRAGTGPQFDINYGFTPEAHINLVAPLAFNLPSRGWNPELRLRRYRTESWGPWTSFGGGGYWTHPGAGDKDWIFLGWEIQRDLSSAVTLGVEVVFHTASQSDDSNHLGFNGGGVLNLDSIDHLMLSFKKRYCPGCCPSRRLCGLPADLLTEKNINTASRYQRHFYLSSEKSLQIFF